MFRKSFLHRFRGSHTVAFPASLATLNVLVEVVGFDQFTTPRLVALVETVGRTFTAPVLTVECPVVVRSSFTATVVVTARTFARDRRVLVPVGTDTVA